MLYLLHTHTLYMYPEFFEDLVQVSLDSLRWEVADEGGEWRLLRKLRRWSRVVVTTVSTPEWGNSMWTAIPNIYLSMPPVSMVNSASQYQSQGVPQSLV